MPFIVFVVAGLVLLFTDGLFDQQHTVGLIITIVGAVIVLLNLLVVGGVAAFMRKRF